ncbi:response regulator [Flavobacterium olei]|uniref:response regulator n=1 Tax=Flavobacterium olei TaxID=1886782 RepID=UPI00321968F5
MSNKYKKIMLIDDSEIDNYIIKSLIKNHNKSAEVSVFCKSEQALGYIQQNKDTYNNLPHIIILDLYMPVIDGFEFLEKLIEMDSIYVNAIRVYVVSSSIDDRDIKRSKLYPLVERYISKPIPSDFFETI